MALSDTEVCRRGGRTGARSDPFINGPGDGFRFVHQPYREENGID
jgi:hypothetical protein